MHWNRPGRTRHTTAAWVLVFGLLIMASDCESSFTDTVAVPVSDSTAPTVGIEVRDRDGLLLYSAPSIGTLDPPHQGTLTVIASANDPESGISAVDILAETKTESCRTRALCSTDHATQLLEGSWRNPLASIGDQVHTFALSGGPLDTRQFVKPTPPEGSSTAVTVSLHARAVNHKGGSATSPEISLSLTTGELASCKSFTLGWNWSRPESSDGHFTGQPNCPSGTGDTVRSVQVTLQFSPGTTEAQSVNVSHGATTVSIPDEGTSTAFNGQDPAGQWAVDWGGNKVIRPIGIDLNVSAW